MLKNFIIIGLGSFFGGGCRYVLSKVVQNMIIYSFPLGTMVVNILGCFLIGLFYGLFERGGLMNIDLKLFLTVGFCGGFTTFSTFMNENMQLLKDGNFFYVALYLAISLIGGLVALYFGQIVTKLI
jgi:CrcB protein